MRNITRDDGLFQSTLSVRRATKDCDSFPSDDFIISIHALREESDPRQFMSLLHLAGFQSTLSVRRATESHEGQRKQFAISIHALREESDSSVTLTGRWPLFQSTLSVRRATGDVAFWDGNGIFQSTLSVRRATLHNLLTRNAP